MNYYVSDNLLYNDGIVKSKLQAYELNFQRQNQRLVSFNGTYIIL